MEHSGDYSNRIKNIIKEIGILKKERGAVILVHNYQLGEVQDIGDFVGDSLELSFKAAEANAETIVFCGVRFMAETAALLSPEANVLLPVENAGCPMADMATADAVKKRKEEIGDDCIVVTYVNSSVEVKAESDICVTSANAEKIVAMLPEDNKILFVPDANLGAYIQRKTGRDIILWDGFCPTHARIAPQHITKLKTEHPDACVIIHPEAYQDAIELADEVLSTGGMIKFVKNTDYKKIIVATEIGIIHRLKKEAPDKYFIPVSEQAVCPNMKLTHLDDVLRALQTDTYKIRISDEIAEKAKKPITRMLELSRSISKNE